MSDLVIPRKSSPFWLHDYPACVGAPFPGHEPFDCVFRSLAFLLFGLLSAQNSFPWTTFSTNPWPCERIFSGYSSIGRLKMTQISGYWPGKKISAYSPNYLNSFRITYWIEPTKQPSLLWSERGSLRGVWAGMDSLVRMNDLQRAGKSNSCLAPNFNAWGWHGLFSFSFRVLLVRVQGQVTYRLQVHRKHAARRDPRAMEPILGPTELWIWRGLSSPQRQLTGLTSKRTAVLSQYWLFPIHTPWSIHRIYLSLIPKSTNNGITETPIHPRDSNKESQSGPRPLEHPVCPSSPYHTIIQPHISNYKQEIP